jgi:hypothetical protein
MSLSFYERITILGLHGKLSTAGICVLMKNLCTPPPRTSERLEPVDVLTQTANNSRSGLSFWAREVQETLAYYKLVDGMLLYQERREGSWILETGDRRQVVTSEFLERCSPDWAQTLREAIGCS